MTTEPRCFDPTLVDQIPRELRNHLAWCNWRYELDEQKTKSKRHSVFTKRPVFLGRRGEHRAWRWASSTKSYGWAPFERVVARYRNAANPEVNDGARATPSTYVDGIGFVFTRQDDFVGIDMDDCINDAGNLHPWARRWVQQFGTYTEVSPRGRGIKMWIIVPGSQGSLLPTLERMNLATEKDRSKEVRYQADQEAAGTGCSGVREGAGVPIKECEVYSAGRYFTVTGARLPGTSDRVATVDRQAFGALLEEMLRVRVNAERQGEAEAKRARLERAQRAASGLELPDHELIEKARSAKNGSEFSALYDRGDLGKYDGDHSGADLALCIKLAFWCGGAENRIDLLFRTSELYREKWEREDYRAATIAEAVRICGDNFYSPKAAFMQKTRTPSRQSNASRRYFRRSRR